MPTYERATRVAAPLDRVWEFHSRVDGLVAVSPDVANLRVESVVAPDGSDAEVLAEGTRIRLSARPFGVGPRRSWTSLIAERERDEGSAVFRDEMVEGPFPAWVHTHRFFGDGDETVLLDRVEYELPCGPLGRAAGPLAGLGLDTVFRYRHRETRRLLEHF